MLLFGTRGEGTSVWLTAGRDDATTSELKLSAGGSKSGGLFGMLETALHIRLTQRIANALRTTLFAKMTRLPMTTLDDHRTGDAVYRVMYDSPEVPEICLTLTLTPLVTLVAAALSVYIAQYSFGAVAPELVWAAAALVPFILFVTFPLSNLARRLGQASRASGAATTNAMEENLDNISAVQSLGGTEKESAKFEAKSAESYKRYLFVVLLGTLLSQIGTISLAVGGIFVAIFVFENIVAGTMTPGDWLAIFGIFSTLSFSASTLGALWIGLQNNVAAVRRVFFFIDYGTEDRSGGSTVAPLQQEIAIEDVDVVYPDGRTALTGINLTLHKRELVAIVGPTGAGKTTLAYLLPRFLQPAAGRVLYDGIDLADVDVDSLRDQVSYVFQEHTLLSKSIRDNFLLVEPTASDADIERACVATGAMEFIEALPDGFDTVLGRSGDTLSVVHQQRLSIARGLGRDTPVLVLDEPTAALDPKTENALVESLMSAAQDRLVIVIAHRLSTIRRADRIVFLEEGQLREVGDHETLMSNPQGAYRRFVELQSG
jgi:ABC-type multidrug transport system fused ATPase/permease subunit